jgi:amidase
MAAVSEVAVSDVAFVGAARQAEMLRAKEVSSRELTELFLERIGRIDPWLNSYREVWAERALREAEEADGKLGSGEGAPLLGVPIAIKDTLDVAGDVTMLGTAGFDQPAAEDSIVVRRLREAGSVILGKTHLPELAIHGFTESKTFGITRNPWNPERTSGGSSGGSGAAVAAGLAAIAHGSDGAGSIRYPAAHCGLFGLKPQRDRVPIDAEHWFGLSVNGCLSRTVADTALFLDAVCVGDPWSATAPPPPKRSFGESAATRPGRLRIAVTLKPPRALAPPRLGDESREAVEGTAELLRSLGHDVEWRDPEWGNVGNQIAARYMGGIAKDIDEVPHADRLEGTTRGYRRIARVAAPDWAIRRALRLEEKDRERIGKIFRDHDILLTPLTAGPAFEHGRFSKRGAQRCLLGESRFYPNAVVWNHLGQPAAAVPAGRSSEDLPLAVQIVARPNDEATLLSLAAQLEAERPWADRTPALGDSS